MIMIFIIIVRIIIITIVIIITTIIITIIMDKNYNLDFICGNLPKWNWPMWIDGFSVFR